MVQRSTSFRLRAGTPQPIKGVCTPDLAPNPPTVGFILQTFKAERSETDQCDDKKNLLCSNDMVGLGGAFVSASYTAQRFLDSETSELVFQAQETRDATIIDESEIPGIGNL